MTVRFILPPERVLSMRRGDPAAEIESVDYGFPDGTEPRVGETVILDGTDAVGGIFTVRERRVHVGLRGPSLVDCLLAPGPTV